MKSKRVDKKTVSGVDKVIARIAKEHLCIEVMEVRNRDRLDFHDVHVASLASALRAAYQAGRESCTPQDGWA